MTTPNKKDKEALGKGIRSLLQNMISDLKTASGFSETCSRGKYYRYSPDTTGSD